MSYGTYYDKETGELRVRLNVRYPDEMEEDE